MSVVALFGIVALLSSACSSSSSTHCLFAEFLSWTFVFASIKLSSFYYPRTRSNDNVLDSSANIISFAVLVAVVSQSLLLGKVCWVLPYLTPTLYFLLRNTADNAKSRTYGAWDGQRRYLAAYLAVAVASSIVLQRNVLPAHALPACTFLVSQAAILYLLAKDRTSDLLTIEPDDSPTDVIASIEPIAIRVWPILGLMCMLSAQSQPTLTGPILSQICISAVIKGSFWILLFVMCRQGYVITSTSMSTFATSTLQIWEQESPLELGELLVVALLALAQSTLHVPRAQNRKLLAFAIVPFLLAFFHSADGYLPATLESTEVADPKEWTYSANSFKIDEVHPIERLSLRAEKEFENMVDRQSKTLEEAVAEYKRRYKRAPPPHFDTWFKMAQASDMVLVDEFDSMMQSLEPFWGLSPAQIRRDVQALANEGSLIQLSIKDHNATYDDDWYLPQIDSWLSSYLDYVPDMNLTFQSLDEPKILVPYDNVQALLKDQSATKERLSGEEDNIKPLDFVNVHQKPWWDLATSSCPIDSPSRQEVLYGQVPTANRGKSKSDAYVEDVKAATDICLNPEYSSKHAFFVAPDTFSFTDRLVPLFSQAKPSCFNDILYPSPYYASLLDAHEYEADLDIDWALKNNTLYWAGSTTGGHTFDSTNMLQQHRQRFVDLVTHNTSLSDLTPHIDVKFTNIVQCTDAGCDALSSHFAISKGESKSASFASKLVFDIDGNSFSGRFWRLLRSKSAILKQALFREWHDDWLEPWVHYIPVSIGMEELPGMLRYLLKTEEGDRVAGKVAERGARWAERVLRKRDVELVFFRLLLEYGRLVDDGREGLRCCAEEGDGKGNGKGRSLW